MVLLGDRSLVLRQRLGRPAECQQQVPEEFAGGHDWPRGHHILLGLIIMLGGGAPVYGGATWSGEGWRIETPMSWRASSAVMPPPRKLSARRACRLKGVRCIPRRIFSLFHNSGAK